MDSNRTVKGLGEASIRVKDLAGMTKFYKETVGLRVLRQERDYVFFEIADGYAGHKQNFAIFHSAERSFLENKSMELSPANSTLHHIAFNIALADFGSEKARLESLGIGVQEVEHPWILVRSLYFVDPEGNTLEFVAYDKSLG